MFIIAGCNGAGKTTASYTVLPEVLNCREFVNADEIARGLSPFNPDNVAIEAGRLMLRRINELLGAGATFAIETTLATRSHLNLVHRAQAADYLVTLVFFWLRTPELALQRVAERVSQGGHGIPSPTVRRRYTAGLRNLFALYMNQVDQWFLYDNSSSLRLPIAHGGRGLPTIVCHNNLFNQMLAYA